MQEAEQERILEIAREMDAAGRHEDAALLARLAGEADKDVMPDLSEEELEHVLEQGEADIAAGRFISDEELWARIEASKPALKMIS